MIKANFNTYATYVTDSLYQWDLNQVLTVSGLNLTVAPEVHFSNALMDKAIVRQSTLANNIVSVQIPNSLLQSPLTIKAHIGIYEGSTFKVVELVEIPVIAKARPADYVIENTDEEIYSFEELKNHIANMVKLSDFNSNNAVINARIDNIIAHNNDTEGNTELLDLRVDMDGTVYDSAGTAVRSQIGFLSTDIKLDGESGCPTFYQYAKWRRGGMDAGLWSTHTWRIMTDNILQFSRDITVKIAEGFRVGFHTVLSDGTFVKDSSWQTGKYRIAANTYFKMVVARVEEDTSETADIAEFSNAVTFESYARAELNDVKSNLTLCRDAIYASIGEVMYPTGVRYTTNQNPPINNRIHADYIECDSLLIVSAFNEDPGYYYGVDLYTNDGTLTRISESGWMSMEKYPTYTVTQNCLVDIVIAKIDGSAFNDLSEMDGLIRVDKFSVVPDLKKELYKIKNKTRKMWLTSAHRGYVDSVLKENTLGAYYNAYLNGADMIEIDARLASDGVLVCVHDETITGLTASGETVTYTVADTSSEDICALILSSDDKWGLQKVPTLEQVLNLAYNTGLIVNIDMKNGYSSAEAIVNLVLKTGMRGKVIYALNGSGMQSINKILASDPDARFIDTPYNFTAAKLADLPDYKKRCFAYTADLTASTIASIRESGCMLALIGLSASNFSTAITYHPEMCEFPHTFDFKNIENNYFDNLKLY